MIKDSDFYRCFDLSSASEQIQEFGRERGSSEVFGDAIVALLTATWSREVEGNEIKRVLGEPDRVYVDGLSEVWEYDWTGLHGPNVYSSATPFLITNGTCTGILKDGSNPA